MTPGGYISDRRCPSNADHGVVISYATGHFCPHSDHSNSTSPLTQSWWTDDQFDAAKSTTSPRSTVSTTPRKIAMKRTRR